MQYRRLANSLEELLRRKEAEVQLLESENQQLQKREQTLQRAIASIDGSIYASQLLKHPCSSSSREALLVSSAAVPPFGHSVEETLQGAHTMASCCKREEMEPLQELQDTISVTGSCSKLYSTQLLLHAAADADQAAAVVRMDRSTRLNFIKQKVMRLGLLLPKYDLQLSPACSARRQADATVDDILRTTLTWMMLDAKQYMSLAMVNLESQQYEPYPPGYWLHVAEAVLPMLSQDQVEAFLTGWGTTKALKAKLASRHQSVLAALTAVQQQQQTALREFNEAASQLPTRPPACLSIRNPTSCTMSSCSSSSCATDRRAVAAPEAPVSCSATPATPGSGSEVSHTEPTCQKQRMQLPDALVEVSLLQVACKEQLELEQELDRITQQLKWPHFCHLLHLINILTKQQLATGMLHAYPYMPDAFSFSEALEVCLGDRYAAASQGVS